MMRVIKGSNFQELYYNAIKEVVEHGKEIEVRGSKTKELHPAMCILEDPTKRTLLYPHRGNNPFATLAETVWVLAGRRDMGFLKKFLPRAPEYSDDDNVWRAGYGPRLRNYEGVDDEGRQIYTDQIKFVYNKLKEDPNTRQAIISVYDAAKESTVRKTKDFPCSNWLHFMIRDDKLDCELVIRSNDIIFGMGGINVYEFTVLQQILAKALGVGVGTYYHYVSSLHLYEHHYAKAERLLNSYMPLPKLPVFDFGGPQFVITRMWKALIENIENGIGDFYIERHQNLKEIKAYLELYLTLQDHLIKDGSVSEAWLWSYKRAFSNMRFTDLQVACYFWLMKKFKQIEPHDINTAVSRCENSIWYIG